MHEKGKTIEKETKTTAILSFIEETGRVIDKISI
jgi:hypothetical protein